MSDLISRQAALAEFIDGRDVFDIMESIEQIKPVQVPNSDLISRQAAIDALGEEPDIWSDTEEEWAYRNAWVEHISALKALPSADRPTGEWVTLERDENVYDIYGVLTWGVNYMCDKCGFITTAIQDHFGQYKFCPNCGARMEGGEE